MATINLLLNLPNYVLQLMDELLNLWLTRDTSIFYIYADAIAYILYIVQFPMVAVYVYFLKMDLDDCRRLRTSIVEHEASSTGYRRVFMSVSD